MAQRWRFAWIGLFLAGLAPAAFAQEVITGDYHWHYDQGAGATLPGWRKFPQIKYPASLSGSPDIHYVVTLQHIGVRGERTTRAMFGDPGAPREAVMNASSQMRLKGPALREGQPFESDVWFAVIFNPAEPGAARGDFPGRLLQVSPVPIPFVRGKQKLPRGRVRLLITPEARAEIVTLDGSNLDETARRAVEDELPHWKFSPAKQAGRAVFSEVTLPVAFLPIESPEDRDYLPPKLIKPVRPDLSLWEKLSRPQGEVRVQFVVDQAGVVGGAAVVRSNLPGLNEASLAAVRQWRFQPALRKGRPVQTTLTFPLRYGDSRKVADEGFFDNEEETRPEPPPAFDQPPTLRESLPVVYPYYLAEQGVTGEARIGIVVGTDGRVRESHIEYATAVEFGRALQAALDAAVFVPAILGPDRHPVEATLHIRRSFNPLAKSGTGPIAVPAAARGLLSRESGPGERIAGFTLPPDRIPVLTRQVKNPAWVETEFWVGPDGEVGLPRFVSYSSEMLAYAVVQELAQRKFPARPEPVLLHARMDFSPAGLPAKQPASGNQ